jgi:outer membrane protein TolC
MMTRLLILIFLSVVGLAQQPAPPPAQPGQLAASDPRLEGKGIPAFPSRSYFDLVFDARPVRTELQSPARLSDYVVGEKIELRLKDYLDLVLVNNTGILIQRLTLEVPRNNILRSFGVFDPFMSGNVNATRATQPTTRVVEGATVLSSLSQPLNLQWQQTLMTGAQIFASYGASRTSNNDSLATFNPNYGSNLGFRFVQPLLRDRGMFLTRLPIAIAKSNLRAAEYNFEDQVLQTIAQAETAYWDVISARENLKVQEQALQFASEALKRAKRELELGAISPLDIFQPEQNYAAIEIEVTRARFNLQAAEDRLRRQIAIDLLPSLRNLPIVLTESIEQPPAADLLDREALVETAYRLRPDLLNARQRLDIDALQLQGAQNRLRPQLALTGQYTLNGRGGRQITRQNFFNPDGTSTPVIRVVDGGFGDALSQMFGLGFPTYGMGLNFNLPIRDRRAAADLADAKVTQKLDAYNVRNAEQLIRVGVLNAVTQVENSRASVRLAQVALDFARKRLEAEQKKYDLGTTTIFFLLAAQNDLTQAQAVLVNAQIQNRRDLLNLDRLTGELLRKRNLLLEY